MHSTSISGTTLLELMATVVCCQLRITNLTNDCRPHTVNEARWVKPPIKVSEEHIVR